MLTGKEGIGKGVGELGLRAICFYGRGGGWGGVRVALEPFCLRERGGWGGVRLALEPFCFGCLQGRGGFYFKLWGAMHLNL